MIDLTIIYLHYMATGIIYREFNKISGKSYIGQTIRKLITRKSEHIRLSKGSPYKFARALQKYKEEDWEWSILAEVDEDKLNEYEEFFIKDLDTYKNGYNSTSTVKHIKKKSNNNPRYDYTIHELWHPNYGVVRGTRSFLKRNYFRCHMDNLISERRQQASGFVLLKNKDRYDELIGLYEFYHPDYGIIKCRLKDLGKKFPLENGEPYNFSSLVAVKPTKCCKGWVLAKNKNKYYEYVKETTITLRHPEHGIQTYTALDFEKIYGLSDSSVYRLKANPNKNVKGWMFYNPI